MPIQSQSQSPVGSTKTQSNKPTPPARVKKSARKRDKVSPLTFPPVTRQKTDQGPATKVGSPTTSTIVPPVGDLFAPVGFTGIGDTHDQEGSRDTLISGDPPVDADHSVFIGTQEI